MRRSASFGREKVSVSPGQAPISPAVNMLGAVFGELVGMFVDDGAFAVQIVVVVISANLVSEIPLAAGAVLLLGCLGVLIANVASARSLIRGSPH
jgi:hypothetical protein